MSKKKNKGGIPNSQTNMRKAHTHINEDKKVYNREQTKQEEREALKEGKIMHVSSELVPEFIVRFVTADDPDKIYVDVILVRPNDHGEWLIIFADGSMTTLPGYYSIESVKISGVS